MRTKTVRRVALALAVLAAASIGVTGPTRHVDAAVNCTVTRTVSALTTTTRASCGGWTGWREFRAKHRVEGLFGNTYWAFGGWTPVDGTGTSSVSTVLYSATSSGYELR